MALSVARGAVLGGRYRLRERIGSGGMGTVWSATQLASGRDVAVKLIRHAAEGEMRRRFLREARAVSTVVHPNVVEVLEVFDADDDTPVIVMELLRGETLAARLAREEKLSFSDCADVLVPALSAVGTAHARGIVHRDLKPANVFLAASDDGATAVKVLDFGIAKLFTEPENRDTQTTRTGSTVGTPSYMAPEQAVGSRDVDHLVDVWAFGVIAYECLAGIRPIEGDTVGQVVMSLMSTGITPLEALASDVPAEVAALVGAMLSRERALRPSDLREPFEVLRRFSTVSAPSFGPPGSDLSELPEPPTTVVEPPSRRSARRSWRRWVLPMAAAGGAIAAMGVITQKSRVRGSDETASAPEATGEAVLAAPTSGGKPEAADAGSANRSLDEAPPEEAEALPAASRRQRSGASPTADFPGDREIVSSKGGVESGRVEPSPIEANARGVEPSSEAPAVTSARPPGEPSATRRSVERNRGPNQDFRGGLAEEPPF